MANKLNLKAVFSADTSDIEKGAKRARQSVKDFEDSATEGVNAFGNALGVNLGAVQRFSSSVEGAFRDAAKTAGVSAESVANLGTAFTAMSAVAAVAIGAVKIGLTELNAVADRFEETLAGEKMKAGSKAFVDTFNAAVYDAMNGEAAEKVRNSWEELWGTAGSRFKLAMSQGIGPVPTSGMINVQAFEQSQQKISEVYKTAERAREIQSRMVELEKEYSDEQTRVALKENEIAELKLKARDDTVSLIERQQAQNDAISQTQTLYEGIISIQQERLKLLKEFNSLTNSGLEDYKAENALTVETAAYSKWVNDAQRELLEYKRTLANLAAAQAKSEAQAAAAILQQKQAAEALAKLKAETPQLATVTSLNDILKGVQAEVLNQEKISVPVAFEPDMDNLVDMTFAVQSVMASAIMDISTSIGEMIGNLATGEEAAGSFAESVLQNIGSWATQIGQIAVLAGATVLSLGTIIANPVGAIVAGAALIAVGAALKQGITNLSANSYAASSYSGSSSYSKTSSDDYITRDISVNVTGTLVASGSNLVAVLNNENNRKNHTT